MIEPTPSRLSDARRAAFAAVVSCVPAALAHELFTFGYVWSLIHWSDAECLHGQGCAGIAVVIAARLIFALPLVLIFGLVGAFMMRRRRGRIGLAVLWLMAYLWTLATMASGYRSALGATWLWHEPFLELIVHPIVTPLLTIAGLWVFLRLLNRRS